jgi:SAM-dependent methyltransferase
MGVFHSVHFGDIVFCFEMNPGDPGWSITRWQPDSYYEHIKDEKMGEHKVEKEEVKEQPKIKLDLGCGKNKCAGFLGVDRRMFEGVDAVTDLTVSGRWVFEQSKVGDLDLELEIHTGHWTLPDSSVEAIHCSHFLEHLSGLQRVQFMNEIWRVLIPGGKGTFITPHWCSSRAYGDFTHQWPPVGEMFFWYLSKDWRKVNAPDNDIEWNPDGYICDLTFTYGYGMRADLMAFNTERQNYAMTNYKEACQDIHCTLVAKK